MQEPRAHRAAILACIAVAALAAVGLVTALVLGVIGHDPTSRTPSPHAAHGQVTSDREAADRAIADLQHDAHLPQAGRLDPATQSALSAMLSVG